MPKISQFPAGGVAQNTDLIPIVRNGGDYTVTGYNLASLASYGQAYVGTFTATAGQTVFTLPASPGSLANLFISVDGAVMVPGSDYTWTTPVTLTFAVGLKVGQTVLYNYTTSVPIGTSLAGGVSGQVQYNNSGVLNGTTIGGDATLVATTGALTVTKTAGVAFAASATTDTTNAANISSGILPVARQSYTQGGTGSVARTVTNKLQESVSVKDFGAVGDGVTNDTTAIQAAITAVNAAGGGVLLVPPGTYIVSALLMKINVRIVGQGQESCIFKSSHTGYGLKMISATNGSTSVQTSVENIKFVNTNGSNTDGGYVDVAGTFVNLFNCQFNGFKYGVIFDQTELATIRQCQFAGNLRAGLWLVNGAEYTVGASGGFTNRIDVAECQFNEGAAAYCVIDDGGYVHSFDNNNYNAGLSHMLIAGANPVSVTNSEFESAASTSIIFSNISAGGVTVGQCTSVLVESNIIVPAAGQSCISTLSLGYLSLINNTLGNSSAAKIINLSGTYKFIDIGNANAGGPLGTINPTYQFRDQDTGSFTPILTIGTLTTGITYATQLGKYTRVGNVVTYEIDMTLTSKGSATGAVRITALPYAAANSSMNVGMPQPFATNIVTATSVGALINSNATQIDLFNSITNYSAQLTDANISNNTTFRMSGSYLA